MLKETLINGISFLLLFLVSRLVKLLDQLLYSSPAVLNDSNWVNGVSIVLVIVLFSFISKDVRKAFDFLSSKTEVK